MRTIFKRVLDASNVNVASEQQVRASRAVALIWKATQAADFKDELLASHRAIARKLRIPFGSYVFQDPRIGGAAQADFYLGYAKPKPGDIEPIIDSEYPAGKTVAEIAANVDAIAERLEAKGYRPLLYGSTSWLRGLYAVRPSLKRLRVWQAEYPRWIARVLKRLLGSRSRLGRGVSVVMWQYSSSWKILGRGFDGSYLLCPLEQILIGYRPPAKKKRRRRVVHPFRFHQALKKLLRRPPAA